MGGDRENSPQRKITPRGKLPRFVYTMFNLRATMRNSTQDNVILNTTHILSRVLAGEERRRSDEFGLRGSERRHQPERLQTCYENHNAVQAYKRNIDQLNIQPITAREINAAF